MNKVVTVNLNGNAYQLEESGYDALRAYLESAASRLGSNPDRDEIIGDIEQAIAEKFRSVLGKFKSVVETKEVLAVITEMGPVEDDASEAETGFPRAQSSSSSSSTPQSEKKPEGAARRSEADSEAAGPARRLYKIPEGAMLAGVCNGVAAYINLDVVIVRIGFIAITCVIAAIALLVHWFAVLPIIVYAVLAIMLPAANSAAERAAARGAPSTAQEYIRRAKQGYYDGLKTFAATAHDHKQWKRRFKQEMRANAYHAHNYMQPACPGGAAAVFALPAIGLLEFALVIAWLLGLISLIAQGSVLGMALPAGVPLWIGIVAMAFALDILLWPLKAFRWACYASVTGDRSWAYRGGFFDTIVWLAAVVAGIWLADHHIPAVHAFIAALPSKTEALVVIVQAWWNHP